MNVLHLSDTQLSGSPIRIVDLLNEHSDVKARHLVWHKTFGFRAFKADLVAPEMGGLDIDELFDWADVLHFHNRYERQEVFQRFPYLREHLKKKPKVIQIHSPKKSEDFTPEIKSGVPLAIIAQYHVRQWPELSFIVPNVVDITSPEYNVPKQPSRTGLPVVSYAPSNVNAQGWDNKGYGVVSPVLKRMKFNRQAEYQLLVGKPHREVMAAKAQAMIGVDEVVTGSYHMSSLEYLGMGIACFCHLDELTEKVVKDLTGAADLPWVLSDRNRFKRQVQEMVAKGTWVFEGQRARQWMERHWSPEILASHYIKMYEKL